MTDNEPMNQLACELFRVFAQFEYCLKATGFCVAGSGDAAKPDWRRFAQELPIRLADSEDLAVRCAIAYILEHPPKKQAFRDGALQWADVAAQAVNENDLVLLYVRRVRNNLFHGGKFNGRFFDPERSQKLLVHSVAILMACIFAMPPMLDAYEHRAS